MVPKPPFKIKKTIEKTYECEDDPIEEPPQKVCNICFQAEFWQFGHRWCIQHYYNNNPKKWQQQFLKK